MARRLTGRNPRSYVGVEPLSPPNSIYANRAPRISDYYDYNIGDFWLQENNTGVGPYNIWFLASKINFIATWVPFGGGGGGGTGLLTLTGNAGGAVPGDPLRNINTIGIGVLTNAGNPGANTLYMQFTASTTGQVLLGQTGAQPIFGIIENAILPGMGGINLAAGQNIAISASPVYLGGAASIISFTGILPIDNGGTFNDSSGIAPNTAYQTNGIFYYDGMRFQTTAVGTATYVLTSNGPGMAPTFQPAGGGGGGTVTGVFGSLNITVVPNTPDPEVSLNTSVYLPATLANGSAGVIGIGSNLDVMDYFISALGTRNTFMGYNAGNLTLTVGDATDNSAFGYNSQIALTSGAFNTTAGSFSGSALTSGDLNTLLGSSAGEHITTGGSCTIVGSGAGSGAASATSTNNIVIGAGAASTNFGGNQNTIVGTGAAQAFTGNYNTIIGYQSGSAFTAATAVNSNLYINNAGVIGESNRTRISSSGVGNGQSNYFFAGGIYPQVSSGTYAVTTTNSADQVQILANGSANEVLTISPTTGYPVWAPASGGGGAVQYAFAAYLNTSVPDVTGNGAIYHMIFDTEVFDIGGIYNTATGNFTAPINGVYNLSYFVTPNNIGASMTGMLLQMHCIGTGPSCTIPIIYGIQVNPTATAPVGTVCFGSSFVVELNAGDYVYVTVQINGGVGNTAGVQGITGEDPTGIKCGFSGFIVTGGGSGGGSSITTTFTAASSPTTWSKNLNTKTVTVIGWNGGSGGGGGITSTGSTFGAGGGGQGGAFIVTLPAAFFSDTETVVVGAGGAGGLPGQTGTAGNGHEGGNTYVGNIGCPLASQYGQTTTPQGGGGGGTASAYGLGSTVITYSPTGALAFGTTNLPFNIGPGANVNKIATFGAGVADVGLGVGTSSAGTAGNSLLITAAGGGMGGFNGTSATRGGTIWNNTFWVSPNNQTILAGGIGGVGSGVAGAMGSPSLIEATGVNVLNPAVGFTPHGFFCGGSGGGGGAYGTGATAGGNGANGGFPGAGGGGAGNSATGIGGTGGAGGNGYLIIIEQM